MRHLTTQKQSYDKVAQTVKISQMKMESASSLLKFVGRKGMNTLLLGSPSSPPRMAYR